MGYLEDAVAASAIDAVVVEEQVLGVAETELDVADLVVVGPSAGDVEHGFALLETDDEPVIADEAGKFDDVVAGAATHVQQRLPRLGREQFQQVLSDLREERGCLAIQALDETFGSRRVGVREIETIPVGSTNGTHVTSTADAGLTNPLSLVRTVVANVCAR